jgi:hypothetical protein
VEKVFITESGISLFVTYNGEKIESFITDGKKEEIWAALQKDILDRTDFVTYNTATLLYAITKQFGIIEC